MSETSNPANEPDTTEENQPTNNDAGSEMMSDGEAEPEALSWEEAMNHNQRLQSQRKTIQISVPGADGEKFVEFEYRMLTESEIDAAEDASVNIESKRNKQEITTDSGALRRSIIKSGVTDGPPGFKATEAYIEQMPHWIKEPLSSAIESFAEMDPVTREGF